VRVLGWDLSFCGGGVGGDGEILLLYRW
jgi:hypothetical protein